MSDIKKLMAFHHEKLLAACVEYRVRVNKLERESAALRADKERLDWLDDRCGWLTYVKEGLGGPWRARCELGKNVTGFGTNARAAIDAARKEAQP